MSRISDQVDYNFVPVEINEIDIYTGILKLLSFIRPEWTADNIKFKVFTDGITNKLVACQYLHEHGQDSDIVLVRIYGNKTDLLIDRTAEVRNITILNKIGLAPKIYGVFKNGLAYEYSPGVTLTPDTVIDAKISRLVARQMAKMHKAQLGKEIKKEPMVWNKIEQFLNLIPVFSDAKKPNRFANNFGSMTGLRIEFESLKSLLINTESPIVFAHNDLLLGNVIHDESKGKISFIDYEYASYNYQAFDIANHFNEFVGIAKWSHIKEFFEIDNGNPNFVFAPALTKQHIEPNFKQKMKVSLACQVFSHSVAAGILAKIANSLSIDDIDYKRHPCKNFQMNWIKNYLEEYLETDLVPHAEIEKVFNEVQKLSLASHFMWGVWSLVQYELSDIDFDFGRYAEIRLNRYYEQKDEVLKELL